MYRFDLRHSLVASKLGMNHVNQRLRGLPWQPQLTPEATETTLKPPDNKTKCFACDPPHAVKYVYT
jgi:hypothetical protein